MGAAKLLNVHPETVRRWIREGKLAALHGTGRQGYRITEEQIRTFLAANPSFLTSELFDELSAADKQEQPEAAKIDEQELDKLNMLRLKKLEELQQLDELIIRAKLGKNTTGLS